MIRRLIVRDLRRGFTGAAWVPIAFFLLVVAMMPFAIGPDRELLTRVGPGVLWIAALTAALQPMERLIEPDRSDGVLDQLVLHGLAEESIALAKIAAHWLTFGPLLLLAAIPGAALLAMDGASLVKTEIAPGGTGRGDRCGNRRLLSRRLSRGLVALPAGRTLAHLRRVGCGGCKPIRPPARSGGVTVSNRGRSVPGGRCDPGG